MLARSLVVFIALVAATFVAVLVLVRTPHGRRMVRDRLEALVSDAIAGSMEIEELTNVWPGTVRARGIVFRDPEGRRVIEIERAAIAFDAAKLFRRRVAIRSANVDGVRISLTQREGKLGIERAFSRGRPPSRGKRRGVAIELENIHFERARLAVEPARGRRLVFADVQGFVAIRRDPGKPVRVRLDRVSAKLAKTSVLDPHVRIEDLRGEIHAKAAEAVDLEFGGTVEGDAMRGAFRYYPHRKPSTEIELDVPKASLRTRILSLGLGAIDRASPSVRVERSLGGPIRRRRRLR